MGKRSAEPANHEARWVIFHNPRCSKSRAALEFLDDVGIEPEIRVYLKNPPSALVLQDVLRRLGVRPRELVRTGEPIFRELQVDWDDRDQVVATLAAHPELLQRPIVLHGDRGVIARPVEKLQILLDS